MVYDIALKDSGTAFNISFGGGVVIDYRQLFFNAVDLFYSIQDGVRLHLKCPNCHYEWQGLKQAASDINELVIFQCPSCLKNIALFVKTGGVALTVQRSDAEGAGGIQ